MISIERRKAVIVLIAVTAVIISAWAISGVIHSQTPVRIGVLLPLGEDFGLKEPLEWARDNINSQGGIGGRQIEFVYKDTESGDISQLAEEILKDDSISIVIGPRTSDEAFIVAPEYISNEKLLLSPFTTSGDIFRAFGGKGYFWRTMQGDVAQAEIIMTILKEKGTKRVALLTPNTTYGKTFYDWTGFFANEYGIDLVYIQEFEQGAPVDAVVSGALQTSPDTIIAICEAYDAVGIKQAIDSSGKTVDLFLADASVSQELIRDLGSVAEGLEGTSPTADPSGGFAAAYEQRFGHAPADYAAPVYDSVLLAAYVSARQDAVLFESVADSMKHVVYGNGVEYGWDADESQEAIQAIFSGKSPDVTGASGPLEYDTEYGVDPVVAYYSHWIVEDGTFRTLETISSAKSGTTGGSSAARTRASEDLMTLDDTETNEYLPPDEKTGFKAVIIGPTSGWDNYRHQSDALAVYTLLRENGVPDEDIILIVYDDVPYAEENPIKGDVHNVQKGENLRYDAVVDYSGNEVTPDTLEAILLGERTESIPVVLESDSGTDIFVYIASHGEPGGISFSEYEQTLPAEDFAAITDTMYRNEGYRQIVFFVDTCFGESIAVNATSPGLLYFTGSAAGEPSFGAVYDMEISQWLSDEFTSKAMNTIRADPEITFRELYISVYEKVAGSHVRLLNAENFGSIDIPVMDYLSP